MVSQEGQVSERFLPEGAGRLRIDRYGPWPPRGHAFWQQEKPRLPEKSAVISDTEEVRRILSELNQFPVVPPGDYLGGAMMGEGTFLTFYYDSRPPVTVEVAWAGRLWATVSGVGSRWITESFIGEIEALLSRETRKG